MQRGLVGSEMCIRDSINAEYMGHQYDEDKKNLFVMLKGIERMIVQMLMATTIQLSKNLQKIDQELQTLKEKIDAKKEECENSDKLLKQLIEFNTKKDFWQIYQIQDKIKKESRTSFVLGELKKDAIKEISSRGAAKSKTATPDNIIQGVPVEIIHKKEELKKLISVSDFVYMTDIGKELNKAIKGISQKVANEISRQKAIQNIVYIKNNPDPLIKKKDKVYLANWILQGKTGKTVELELLLSLIHI
eukprot:TRINITY_DN24029_c0_g1_i1.p1 TRINITY_DN24029_c0_g1~~TRINITY_DN24029_c0_g1_i1.p1  ORF type:complete len:247 (-),score=81.95 TRINITY_DN24029_c0_g1_i1:157-897(-)